MALGPGRSGPLVRHLIGPEQQRKALQNIAHFIRVQDPDAVDEPCAIDRSDLGDVYDTCPRKSCLTSPQAHVAWHGSKPKVRCDCDNYRGGDGASIEAVVLDDQCGPALRGC